MWKLGTLAKQRKVNLNKHTSACDQINFQSRSSYRNDYASVLSVSSCQLAVVEIPHNYSYMPRQYWSHLKKPRNVFPATIYLWSHVLRDRGWSRTQIPFGCLGSRLDRGVNPTPFSLTINRKAHRFQPQYRTALNAAWCMTLFIDYLAQLFCAYFWLHSALIRLLKTWTPCSLLLGLRRAVCRTNGATLDIP